jgi:two-component system nitrogen regulation sensor histidine kinase GlnL
MPGSASTVNALHDYHSPLSNFEPTELFDSLSTGIVVLDAQLCPIYANVSAQDFMAVSLRQARGRPFADLFYDPRQLVEVLRRSTDNLETCTQHELVLKALGSAAHRDPSVIDLIVTPLEGQVTGTYLLLELTDATQRQRISRDNDILAGMDGSRLMVRQLAHEVKNPLGGLRGAAQLLAKELGSPELREYTAIIISEADRLVALVDSMAISNGPPRKDMLNIHELCEHVVKLIRAEAPAGVQIDRDYDPSLPDGMFDRHQIVQALLNIARNAMQAVGAHGRITVRTRARSGLNIGKVRHRLAAAIEVEDNGGGVPADLIKTLFLPLVTGRTNGTGLGLAVAQDLATRHGGIIEFTSQPGRTIFSLLLPIEGNKE